MGWQGWNNVCILLLCNYSLEGRCLCVCVYTYIHTDISIHVNLLISGISGLTRKSIVASGPPVTFLTQFLILQLWHKSVCQSPLRPDIHTISSDFIVGYTGCPRRNGQNFGSVFLMLNYTDITQNTYIQNWTVTEIMAIEKCGLLGCPRTVRHPWRHTCPVCMPGNETPLANIVMQWPWQDNRISCSLRKVLGNLRKNTTVVRVFL